MNKIQAIELILKQLTGALSETERILLDEWLHHKPENKNVYTNLVQLHQADWRSVVASPSTLFLEQQREAVRLRIAGTLVQESAAAYRIRIAAVITLALCSTFFIYFTASHRLGHGLMNQRHIAFYHTALDQAVRELEQVYGVSIKLADKKLAAERITGIFIQEDVGAVLTAFTLSLPIEVEQHRSTYVLKTKP